MNTSPFIAIGYDGSPCSGTALAWAATMAARRREEVVATIVLDQREFPHGIDWPESWWTEIEDQARAILEEFPEVRYRLVRQKGHKIPNLLEAAREASMLVVGSHGHSVAGQMLIGSVSQSLARVATTPLVVVREPRTSDAARIVVGYDGSALSKRAFEFACQMAELTGDKVLAVQAWQRKPEPEDEYDGPLEYDHGPLLRTGSIDETEAALQDAMDEMRVTYPTVGIDSDLVVDVPPGRALVHASSSASLVVVGAHIKNAFTEALLGSVGHDVLHKAHCPVAVVK
jgi:nucleotide-binding universal stress UspA family protein